ncbi:MAG: sodium:solute symporter [Opitutales bacterium]|nr:sodium:solute symporter [Opitutales bacterium]
MNEHLTVLDGIILAVYFTGVLGIGFYFYFRSRTMEGFTAGGRSLPGWVCGLSILATYLSSISFIALPGRAYADNWNPFVFSLSLPIAVFLAARYFVPLYRRNTEVSAYSYLEKRFGLWARTYAGVCYLLLQLARMGAVMYLVALPMSLLLGWEMQVVILVLGLSVMAYTAVGGIVGVIWADALQAVVLTVGAVVCLVLMVFGLPEGPGQLFSVALEHDKFSFGSFGPSLAEATFWVVLIYGVFINLNNFGIDQGYIQRYIAAKSDREARRSVWLGGLLYLPVSALFFMIGTALFVYYHVQPELLPAELEAAENPDRVFPYFVIAALPPGLTGLLISAVFAAAMSTVSTSLNSSATLLLTDFYKRYFRPAATDRESMRVLYGATVIWGTGGTLMGLAMIGVKHALDAWWQLASIFSGGMLGLFLLGVVSQKVRNVPAFCGVVAGVLVISWLSLSPYLTGSLERFQSPFHGFLTIVIGTLVIFLVGMAVARWRK